MTTVVIFSRKFQQNNNTEFVSFIWLKLNLNENVKNNSLVPGIQIIGS